MQLTLSNLKVSRHMSEETTAFTCDILVDGVKVGSARNSGTGGCNSYYFDDRTMESRLQAWAATQPKHSEPELAHLPIDLDTVLERMIVDQEEAKELRRLCRTKVVFRLKGDAEGRYRTLKAGDLQQAAAHIRQEYGDRIERIVNDELSKPTTT